jgi:PAS domain-containing protein
VTARPGGWVEGFAGAVTVCDADGVIIEMNERAGEVFAVEGGLALIGMNVLDCHPEPSRSKLAAMLIDRRENVYTITRKGSKKLVFQAPWHEDGEYRGFVEIVLNLPPDVPDHPRG